MAIGRFDGRDVTATIQNFQTSLKVDLAWRRILTNVLGIERSVIISTPQEMIEARRRISPVDYDGVPVADALSRTASLRFTFQLVFGH